MAAAAFNMTESLESRVARLESDVTSIRSDISDIKIDLRQMRGEISGLHTEMQTEFKAVRTEMREESQAAREGLADLRREIHRGAWAFAALTVTLFVTMLSVMARGFGWIH